MPLHRYIGQITLLLCSLAFAGCHGSATQSENQQPRPGHVTHIVVFWLKDPGSAEQRRDLIAACHTLKDIPGVTDLRVGQPLPSTRPVVDSTYDVALVITFENERAMEAYNPHPIHEKLAREFVPSFARWLVYDFTNR
jgi:hypothetical protein